MAALNFPSSPVLNDVHTENGATWTFNGTGWVKSLGLSFGTGVTGALSIAVGSAGSFVVLDGALGTPSAGVLTNCTGYQAGNLTDLGVGVSTFLDTPSGENLAAALSTGLPIATGVGGLGTGVATALAANTGATGGMVLGGSSPSFGTVTASGFFRGPGFLGANTYVYVNDFGTGGFIMGDSCQLAWSNGSAFGSKLAALNYNIAGNYVEINNGTAGTLRDLNLRNLTASGTVTGAGLTLNDSAFPLYSVAYVRNAASITASYGATERAQFGIYGLNLNSDGVCTWSNGVGHALPRDLQLSRLSASLLGVGSNVSPTGGSVSLAHLTVSGTVKTGAFTVGTTPTHVTGAEILISSVTGATVGAAVTTGGGGMLVKACSNGTQWICTAIIIP